MRLRNQQRGTHRVLSFEVVKVETAHAARAHANLGIPAGDRNLADRFPRRMKRALPASRSQRNDEGLHGCESLCDRHPNRGHRPHGAADANESARCVYACPE
jgi:hypothetical protein